MKPKLLFASVLAVFAFADVAQARETRLPTPSERYHAADTKESVSFRRHVIPLFSRAGCSGRECHGAFSGQGGFSLSLFGYDFAKDHKEIVADEEDGVRVDVDHPAQSLILLKPTMEERHKGKERIKKGSWEYNLVRKWISEGAKIDVEETGAFGRLEVFPKEIVFAGKGETVQLKVLCHWQDGTVEDVTELTRFRTNDESVAEVSDTGVITSLSSGDTHVVAFYDNGVHPIPVMRPVSDRVGAKYPKIAANTRIDELVLNKLKKVGIVPSETCTDLEFLRRVTLDMTGTLPTPEEVKAFAADPSSNKRSAKIEELLERDTYAAWWATKLNDFTGNNASQINERLYRNDQSLQWYEWIRSRVEKNTPYDELVSGIVLATSRQPGQSYLQYATEMSSYLKKNKPKDFADRRTMPHYWARRNIRKAEEKALSFAHAFLGVQIQCAQCHKHPFDQWTQQDFKQFQAFFDGIQYGSNTEKGDKVTYKSMQQQLYKEVGYDRKNTKTRNKLYAEIRNRVAKGRPVPWQELYIRTANPTKKTGRKRKNNTGSSRVLTPKILGGDEVHLTEYPDPRAPLMEWMAAKENPYFAKAFVNRVWANYFGRGIVHPADDMNLANPPSNAELLNHLADGFVESGYDMKWLHRTITGSDAYQRSWKPNDTNELDEKNFSKMKLRRLPAEVVADAINQAVAGEKRAEVLAARVDDRMIGPMLTGVGNKRGNNYALELFGKPVRLTNCDCERMSDPTLLQTLYTRNDDSMLGKIDNGGKTASWIGELRKKFTPDKDTGKTANSIKNLESRAKQYRAKLKRVETTIARAKDEKTKLRFQKQLKTLQKQVRSTENQIAKLEKQQADRRNAVKLDTDELIEETFLRTVSRLPTDKELTMARKDIAAAGEDPIDGVRDLLWAMLNTKEFIINH